MNTMQFVAVGGIIAASVFLLFAGVLMGVQQRQESAQRLRTYTAPTQERANDSAVGGAISGIDSWMAKRKFGGNIARNLAQADIKLTVVEYVLLQVGLLALGMPLGAIILKAPIGGLLGAVLMYLVPGIYVSRARGKRLQAFNEQVPTALDSLSSSLRGGYGLVQAMSLVAAEMLPPMSVEMQRVVSEVSYGLPYELAFKNMLRRNTSPDLGMVITAIEINLEVGGNLAEILDNIGAIIRDRMRIQGQVRSYTAQARFSAMVLTALPFGLAGIIYLTNPSYMSQLWSSTFGLVLMAIGGTLIAVASVLLRKIAQIDI